MTNETIFLNNLRHFRPKFYNGNANVSVWNKLPISRRSSVLVLLFLGRSGELRVVLTKRSRSLRNFGGHVAFPGGKADNGLESPWMTARREAFEEIGLPLDHDLQKMGFQVEKLTMLPCFIARTILAVKPCVGILKNSNNSNSSTINQYFIDDKFVKLKLNPGESSSLFSVPLHDFMDPRVFKRVLSSHELDTSKRIEYLSKTSIALNWAGIKWFKRSLIFPKENQDFEAKWINEIIDLSDISDSELQKDEHYREAKNLSIGPNDRNVWGLTANILTEVANITYKGSDYWKNMLNIGEEELIWSLSNAGGQFKDGPRSDFEKKIIAGEKNVMFTDVLQKEDKIKLDKIYNHQTTNI